MELKDFLWSLIVIYTCARVMAELAVRMGQSPVLGDLLAGVLIGGSLLGWVHETEILKLLGAVGVILLLFEIGLESDIQAFLKVSRAAVGVAVVGVTIPFLFGFGMALAFDLTTLQALFIGTALTPTSVAIPARVLAELGKLKTQESNVLLGAAIVDDILALIGLSVILGLVQSGTVSWMHIGQTTGIAILFLGLAIVVGARYAHLFSRLVNRMNTRGNLIVAATTFALLLGEIAETLHMAPLVGAFAAGLVLARTEHHAHIVDRIKPVADIFVPIFFVLVGVAVDLRHLNPFDAQNWPILLLAAGLSATAILGKLASGLGVRDKGVNRWAIGVGMVPRGEVMLIIASVGLSNGVFDQGIYGALLIAVLVSTFLPPILLKRAFKGS
jgi:Kef-type K+ transport system membrane component KefB